MLRATQADTHETVARPARSIAFQNTVKLRSRSGSFVATAAQRLATKGLVQFRAFCAFFDAANGFAERLDFALGIELGIAGGIVIVVQLLGDATVAHANHVASGKMHQPGVMAFAEKVEQMDRGIHVGRKGVTQVGVEIRQPGTVDDKVERIGEPRLRFLVESETREAHVPFDDF